MVWTDRQVSDKSRAGVGSSCGEKQHFYLEQAIAVANFVPVLEMIFFCNIMTPHHGVQNTERGLEMGDGMWCLEQA